MIRKLFGRFFLFCSGASEQVLKQCPHVERTKHASIGVTVLFTGIFACFSCFYALYRVFLNEEFAIPSAIAISILWGIFVFNLDRFLVSTVRKEGVFMRDLKNVSPRILLAIVIAIVIATPLKVKIFEDRLVREIYEMKKMESENDREDYKRQYNLEGLENRATEIETSVKTFLEKSTGEPEGELFPYKLQLHQKCLQEKDELWKKAQEEIPTLQTTRGGVERRITTKVTERDEIRTEKQSVEAALGDVTARVSSYIAQESQRINRSSVIGEQRVQLPVAPKELRNEKQEIEKRLDELRATERGLTKNVTDLVNERASIDSEISRLNNAPGIKDTECSGIYGEIETLRKEWATTNAEQAEEARKLLEAQRKTVGEAQAQVEAGATEGAKAIEASYSMNFLTQLEALDSLLDKRFTTVWWTHWMLSILFVLVETAPIFVKLLTPKSPYDTIADRIDQESIITGDEFAKNYRFLVVHDLAKDRVKRATEDNKTMLDDQVRQSLEALRIIDQRRIEFYDFLEKLSLDERSQFAAEKLQQIFVETVNGALDDFNKRNEKIFKTGIEKID